MSPNHSAKVDVYFCLLIIKKGTFIYKKWKK